MYIDENTIKELIQERDNLINEIKEYESNNTDYNKVNSRYKMMNEELISLTKGINSLLLNLQFSYSRYNTHGLNYPEDYIVFDTETAGLDPNNNEIIEYSFLKYKDNKLVDKLSSLVKPSNPIPEFITNITHISNEMVKDALPIDEHLESIVEFINGSVIIGHNILFDIKFLESTIKRSPLELDSVNIQYIDTVSLARKSIPDAPNHKLETLKNYLNIDNVSHRSESDCEVTQIVYMKCVEKLIEQELE